MKPITRNELGLPTSRRWNVEPTRVGWHEEKDDGMLVLFVRTPRGTGPGVFSRTIISPEFLADRRALAWAIRQGRRAATRWRAEQIARRCPLCGLIKDGDGRLCAYCARAARIQLEEDNKL